MRRSKLKSRNKAENICLRLSKRECGDGENREIAAQNYYLLYTFSVYSIFLMF